MLNQYREKIDKIDKEIIKLFEDRMEIVKEVAIYKKENNIEIFNENRELEVLNKIKENLLNKNLEKYLVDFYIKFMNVSKEYQKDIIKND